MPDASFNPNSDTPPKKRRFRLRYSLRSLLIFMLLFSASLALREGWSPWQIEYVLRGHLDRVLSASFSPDGRRIVTASTDGTARVWDGETGLELHVLKGHEDVVFSAAFSPDGRRIVTGSWDKTARVWDAETGRKRHVLKGHTSSVRSSTFSPDSRRIVTASLDDTARVWRRIRPEMWWGVFWLPQFWFTVLFAVGFFWSLRRDYNRLMRVQPS